MGGGGGRKRDIVNSLCPARRGGGRGGVPRHINYLCTYDLYSPVHNVLDACISITGASGRGLGPGIREFFGPCEMASSR